MLKIHTWAFPLLFLANAHYSSGAEITFTPLGDLPGGPFDSVVNGIAADGSAAVGFSKDFQGRTRAIRWTSSAGMISLGTLPGGSDVSTAATGRAVSGDGAVVVGYSGSETAQSEAFRWTFESGMVGLGTLEPFYSTFAGAVSGDGSTVVGRAETSTKPQAFRWTANKGMQRLPGMSAESSSASAVSWDGSVIVGSQSIGNDVEAFRWTGDGGAIGLGFLAPADFVSDAYDITPDGSVIVGTSSSSNGTRSFRWTQATGMVQIGGLGTYARSVSADGSVIVGITDQLQGFIWTEEGGMADLQELLTFHGIDVTAWHQMQIRSISADGNTVAGFGIGPRGREAFIATIPEPSTGLLIGLGFAALLWLRQALLAHKKTRRRPVRRAAFDGFPPREFS